MDKIDEITGLYSNINQTEKQPYIYIHFDVHNYGLHIEANIEGLDVLKNEIVKTITSSPKNINDEISIFYLEKTKSITSSNYFFESIEIIDKIPLKEVIKNKEKSGIDITLIVFLVFLALLGIIFIVGFITSIKYLIFQFL